MATKAEYVILIKGSAAIFNREMNRVKTISANVRKTLKRLAPILKRLALGFGAVSAAVVGFGLKMAMEAETAAVAFEVLIGSAETATKVLDDLRKFAAATPFQFPDLRQAAQLLLAFNIEADKVVPTLRRIGDISAGIQQPIAEIAEMYGKAAVQGRLFGEDVNQFTGRGIPLIQELAKQFEVSTDQVKKLVSEGKVGFSELEQAIISLTDEGGKFAGMMERLSATTAGRISTLKDNFALLAETIGIQLLPALERILVIVEQLMPVLQTFAGDSNRFARDMADNLELIGWLMRPIVTWFRAMQTGLIALQFAAAKFLETLNRGFEELSRLMPFVSGERFARDAQYWETAADSFAGSMNDITQGVMEMWGLQEEATRQVAEAAEQAESSWADVLDSMTGFRSLADITLKPELADPLLPVRRQLDELGERFRESLSFDAEPMLTSARRVFRTIAREFKLELSDEVERAQRREFKLAPALVRGTIAYSQAARRGAVDPMKQIEKHGRDQVKELREQTGLLENIAGGVAQSGVLALWKMGGL